MKRKIFINLILIRPWLCKSLSFSFEIFHLLLQIFFPLISRTQRAISVIVNRRPSRLDWGLGWNAEEQFVVSSIASERKCLCYANYKDIWKVNRMNFIPTVRDRLRHVFELSSRKSRLGMSDMGQGGKIKIMYVFISISTLSTSWGNISKNHSRNTRIFSYSYEYIFPHTLSFWRAPYTPAGLLPSLQPLCRPHSKSFPFRINIP